MTYKKRLKAIKESAEKVRKRTIEIDVKYADDGEAWRNEETEMLFAFYNEVVNELEGLKL